MDAGGKLSAQEQRLLKSAYNALKPLEEELGAARSAAHGEPAVKPPEIKPARPHEPPPVKPPAHGEPVSAPTAGKDLAKENAVRDSARKAHSTLALGDETHGIAAYGKGKGAGFQFCSEPYCSLVRGKVGAILDGLPTNYDKAMIQDVRDLYIRISRAEELLKRRQAYRRGGKSLVP